MISNNTSSGFYACGNTAQAVIATTLGAGTYYIAVEGNGGTYGNYNLGVWAVNYSNTYCGGSDRLSDETSEGMNRVTSIFPNPAKDQFTVVAAADEYVIQVFDLNGTMLKQVQSTLQTQSVSAENLPNGMYLVVIKNNDNILFREKIQIVK